MNKWPETLHEAIQHFADPANCHEFMVFMRWPDGKVKCPTCGSDKVTYLKKVRRWKCYAKHPKAQFSAKVGTIFEDSPISLEKWLPAAWLIINCKNGISSYELARDLGVTQKTAWFMLHRIRLAMQTRTFEKLDGEVEADESYIGGKARNMHKIRWQKKIKQEPKTRRGLVGKVTILGVLKRDGEFRAKVAPEPTPDLLEQNIKDNVHLGADLFTDDLVAYWGLSDRFMHQVVSHAENYVVGRVHTNGCENFWSLLKRTLGGTYISVEPFHLFRYLDEQTYRFNRRKLTDGERFTEAMRQVVGRRLTYEELTGKTEKQPG